MSNKALPWYYSSNAFFYDSVAQKIRKKIVSLIYLKRTERTLALDVFDSLEHGTTTNRSHQWGRRLTLRPLLLIQNNNAMAKTSLCPDLFGHDLHYNTCSKLSTHAFIPSNLHCRWLIWMLVDFFFSSSSSLSAVISLTSCLIYWHRHTDFANRFQFHASSLFFLRGSRNLWEPEQKIILIL